ncbi:MAG: DUF3592 domain-containing protein [Terriglobales bacterium]
MADFVIAFLIVLCEWLWNEAKRRLAEPWPSGHGEVTDVRVDVSEYSVVHVTYWYTVNGEYYSGYWRESFLKERDASEFGESWKGRKVIVHYRHDDPEKSVLWR